MKISQFIALKFIPIVLASVTIYSSSSSAQSQTNLPTRTLPSKEGNFILLPDWQRISFNQMPAIQNGGSMKVNGLSRAWNAGDTPDKYLTLGDIDEALKPQFFSIRNITNENNLKNFSLESFPLLGEQTVQNLVELIPNLGQTNAAK
ncbi:M23 family peptidase, partial [Rivularia sp. UHCC 0363]|nr:M23 family peptidase [Rivularia sp. UHCC 0363]